MRKRVADGAQRIALIGAVASDTRDVMVEGESGILACCIGDENRPRYEPSKRRVTWPNGARATLFSADEPQRLRGPQHDTVWLDELCAYRNAQSVWDMMRLGLRLSERPRAMVTTTPKPIPTLRALMADPGSHVTRGNTYENRANLAATFFDEITRLYSGTRLGRQEIYAELLDASDRALWTRDQLESLRVSSAPELDRIVVAIDPAVSSHSRSDETGIIVAGRGVDGAGYVLADLSGRYSPEQWARIVVDAYDEHGADRVVAEVNNGGDMVEAVLRTVRQSLPYRSLHASRGKRIRAEPIAAMYEQGRIHHVTSSQLDQLEDQLCTWDSSDGSPSPDRLDAMVWAFTELMRPHAPAAYRSLKKARRMLPRRRI